MATNKTRVFTNIQEYEKERDELDSFYYTSHRYNYANRHYHKQMEMIFVNAGTKTIRINNIEHQLSKGDFAICNPYDLHEFLYGSAKVTVVCIPYKYQKYFDDLLSNDDFTSQIIKANIKTWGILAQMQHMLDFEKCGDTTKKGHIITLLGKIMDCFQDIEIERNDIPLKQQIIDYIDNNLCTNLTLDNIAHHCGFSRSHFSREFNTLFNCNINKYINLKRLKLFINLHLTTNNSISVNAYKAGFPSIRTFYNVFREHYNASPKEYLSYYINIDDDN